MAVCSACGKENPESARFCNNCAAALTGESREQRKTVTVLFCDVTGSTAMGESTDPEALRALLARYFERMKAIVESHGGTVEKFIGDAVMAVFGIPQAHEDDALRACRAAVEMRDALPDIGVRGRIGVNTGEVVTGTSERLATGDAVNVAARFEQAAEPGEVLIGEPTHALVREAVVAEPVEPLILKGKSEPVPAYRLVRVGESPERAHGDVFVGRGRELDLIFEAWTRAAAEQRCELVTVVAEAGIGKTRLVAEALSHLDGKVVRGRCLSYGEGITYWPVVEVVKQLDARPSDAAAAAAIGSLLGETEAGTSAEQIAWAFRKLLEEQAPLVCVFEDLHWGEETFLDLIEHVALLSAGSQVLLVCTARPELLDRRPSWPVTLRLAPLDSVDVDRLVPASLSVELRERILTGAGGNPLFVTEMVAMAEGGEVRVPPTLQALLTARLDQLDGPDRRVLERGAVEGEVFHRGAVQTLTPDEPQVTARLASLVRRDLVRPDRAQIPGDDGFRFRHLLIRDAAYDALPKSARAGLHERFAGWLEEHGGTLVELDEILGHHLEQADRYRAELGTPDPDLAQRAGNRLASAGRRALWRGDHPAAAGLLERALQLTRPQRFDIALELDLVSASVSATRGRDWAVAAAEDVAERARAAGNRPGELLARAVAVDHRMTLHPEPGDVDAIERLATEALELLDPERDHAELKYAWTILAHAAGIHCRMEEGVHACEEALRHARLAGFHHWFPAILVLALHAGPRPADEALRTLDVLMKDSLHPGIDLTRAALLVMLGQIEEGLRLGIETQRVLNDLGGEYGGNAALAEIQWLAGDQQAAVESLRRSCAFLERRGQVGNLSYHESRLGRMLCMLGRHDEAEPLAARGREFTVAGDGVAEIAWRQTQALVDSYRGRHAEAEALAREAVAFAELTDMLDFQGDALSDLGQVLASAGKPDDARAVWVQALERYERKRNRVMATRLRERLDEAT